MIPRSLLIRELAKVNNDKTVLLTFDDGPDPEVTPQVLELLSEFGAKAIFFVPGRRIKRAPKLLSRIIKEGHVVGNHTFVHSNSRQPGFFSYLMDLRKCQDLIKNCIDELPNYFRPPRGVVSLTTLLAPKLVGLKTMLWSVDVKDWKCTSEQEAVTAAEKLLDRIKPGDIVLLHDDNKHVLTILKYILPAIKDKGIDLFNHEELSQ